ncbi:MAG TPA: PAS domain-containing protein [Mycobacterium sp.]|nr:PAS domain-containing protein [Mycobacterium sp.]
MHGDRLQAGITMRTSPEFSERRSEHAARGSAALQNADTDGDGHNTFVDLKVGNAERRRRPPPSAPEEYLYELPALILLERLAIPMLATRLDGVVVYTNPAFATMLGYPDTITLTGLQLPALLAGHAATPPHDCVTALRAAGTVVVDWLHAEGFPVRGVISDSLFARATDQILLVGVTDVTELMWTIQPAPR